MCSVDWRCWVRLVSLVSEVDGPYEQSDRHNNQMIGETTVDDELTVANDTDIVVIPNDGIDKAEEGWVREVP